ncbi:MAG: phosphate-starvation-inducible PsiE family protein [Thioalkalivibrionaceae bacterium]
MEPDQRLNPSKTAGHREYRLRLFGTRAIHGLELFVLGVITVATVVAILQEIWVMIDALHVTLADILLLFILLEVLAMVAVVLKAGRLPVELPLLIAIVALARYLIIDAKSMALWQILGMTGGVVLLTAAIVMLRLGNTWFPARDQDELHEPPSWHDDRKSG